MQCYLQRPSLAQEQQPGSAAQGFLGLGFLSGFLGLGFNLGPPRHSLGFLGLGFLLGFLGLGFNLGPPRQ